VAVVTDIRSFYPSVEGTRAFQLFEGRAATGIQDEGLRRATLAFAKHQLDSSPRGIPIGTELSHLLASVSTGPLDDALAHAFGERYFRYVDDLVVVCDRSQAERVQSRIREILDGEGLEMNAEKTDVMSKEDWSRSPYDDPQSEIARFSALMRDVAVFLTMRPRSYCDLVKASVDRGLTLPLMRLKSNASYGRFRLFVGSYRQLLTRLRVRLGGIKAIVACACELRERMMEGLRYLAGSHAGQNKVLRRWRTQRARALATRLFYLLPVREYDRIDCTLSTLEDVGDLRALACAVRSGDVGNIVACPGPLVSALAELLVESGVASVRVEEQAPGSPEREEGLRTLRLMGVAVQNTETTGVGAKCTEWLSVKWPRQFDQVISFNDELASICGDDVGYREVAELLRTRLEDRESVALAAVRLSSLSYS
jgi:hypothetical protein